MQDYIDTGENESESENKYSYGDNDFSKYRASYKCEIQGVDRHAICTPITDLLSWRGYVVNNSK